MTARMWQMVRAAFEGWWNDRALSLGASIAFFTVFSLAPMLLVAVAVAGLAFGRDAAQGAVVAQFAGLIGREAAGALEAMIASAGNVGSGLVGTMVGVTTFLLLATGAIVELQDDLNIIWKVKHTGSYGVADFVRTRLLSLALILGIGFLLLVSLVIDAGLSAVSTYLERAAPAFGALLRALNFIFGLGVATLLFAMIFKILPAVDLTWRDVAVGALATGLLFSLGKILIGAYLGRAALASSYGTAASILTLLLWIYYSALILLFGAEFTKVFAESWGSRAGVSAPDAARC